MQKTILISLISSVVLSACATAPELDYSKVDAVCGQKCKTEATDCQKRFDGYPTLLLTHCKPELRICVQACPPPGTNPPPLPAKTNISPDKPSVTDRLKLLEELHKSGVITDKEYADKRQEIINSL